MTYARYRTLLFLSAVLVAACSDNSATGPGAADRMVTVNDCRGPATSLDPAIAATFTRPPVNVRNVNDVWADIARTTPGGFAGISFEANGQSPKIYLTDVSQASAARTALAPILAQTYPTFDVAHATIAAARWNSAQLLDWYLYLTGQPIWMMPNVTITTSGINSADNRIEISTADAAGRALLVSKLQSMSLPCDLIRVGIELPGNLTMIDHAESGRLARDPMGGADFGRSGRFRENS